MPESVQIAQKEILSAGFIPDAPLWGMPESWQEANQSMDHIMNIHRFDLDTAAALARKIEDRLESIFL